ncbi:Protein of uncharacterised function (DUF2767) [Klebsiella oxytoca]|nr:Protein of uncharacterised function (DUF2767) [Klebsiella oxytoca]
MGNTAKDEALYQEMCRVVGKVVLEMRDLGQEPKHIVIAGVLRTALAKPEGQALSADAGSDGEGGPCAFRQLAGPARFPELYEITKRITALTAISQWWATIASSSMAGIGSSR